MGSLLRRLGEVLRYLRQPQVGLVEGVQYYRDSKSLFVGDVSVSNDAVINRYCKLMAFGDSGIALGSRCYLGESVVIVASDNSKVLLEDDVCVHPKAVIIGPARLKRGCVIGSRARVRGGEIGQNGMLAHGSNLVNAVVPSNELWSGDPAESTRSLTESEIHGSKIMHSELSELALEMRNLGLAQGQKDPKP